MYHPVPPETPGLVPLSCLALFGSAFPHISVTSGGEVTRRQVTKACQPEERKDCDANVSGTADDVWNGLLQTAQKKSPHCYVITYPQHPSLRAICTDYYTMNGSGVEAEIWQLEATTQTWRMVLHTAVREEDLLDEFCWCAAHPSPAAEAEARAGQWPNETAQSYWQ